MFVQFLFYVLKFKFPDIYDLNILKYMSGKKPLPEPSFWFVNFIVAVMKVLKNFKSLLSQVISIARLVFKWSNESRNYF